MTAKIVQAAFGLMAVLFAGPARGDSTPVVADVPPEGQPVAVAPPPYSLPWGLPSTFAGTVVRLDSSFAFSHDATDRNVITVASIFPAASSSVANRWMTVSGDSAEAIEFGHELFQRLSFIGFGLPQPDPGEGEIPDRLAHPAGGGKTLRATEAPLGFGLGT